MTPPNELYGVLAEFAGPEELLTGTRRAYESGYRQLDAYSPMPIEGLADALEFRKTRMPLVILIGGIVGGLSGYALLYWVSVIHYPMNVGGRPFHSWPAFIPITFEMTILFGTLAGVLGMLGLNGLPRPHHPLFGVEAFSRASRDGFFLCIESSDPQFDPAQTREFLTSAGAVEVYDVPS